jgi:tellurite resistance protein TerA
MRKLGASSLRLGSTTFSFSGADFQDEKAVIVGEIYKREGLWRFGAVGQGFNGGLSALLKHFGGTEAQASPAPASTPAAAPAPSPEIKPVNLNKIFLTKKGESSRISLKKGSNDPIRIKATWIDNMDSRSDNDDLDLRAGILLHDGKMHWLAASHPGSLDAAPFARHLGDVRQATKNAPGTEIIEVNPEISKRLGGPVGLVFSVYSAISNGPVSIASLKPVMFIENGKTVVECRYDFPDGEAAKNVYTYVIGALDIDGDTVTVKLSGLTSKPCSENTPWIERKAGALEVSFEGVPVFKAGRNMFARMLGVGGKKYVNV